MRCFIKPKLSRGTYDPITGFWIGTSCNDQLRGTSGDDLIDGREGNDHLWGKAGDDFLRGGAGNDHLWGGAGDDRLEGQDFTDAPYLRDEVNFMWGGPGDDTYDVNGPGDRVMEKPCDGIDTVQTLIGFTLPDHVENLVARYPVVLGDDPLVGNDLDNLIAGAPFSYETILGLGGNDTLDGGGRVGAYLDAGEGNDVLILSFGECVGGPGADTFVAGGRGAHTSPDAPIKVFDFNGEEGDRLWIRALETQDPQALFEQGMLQFDPSSGRLVLDYDPSTPSPTSVDQVFILVGVQSFDPQWISIGPL